MARKVRLPEFCCEDLMLGKPKKPPRKSPKAPKVPKKEQRLTIQPVGKPWSPKKKPKS